MKNRKGFNPLLLALMMSGMSGKGLLQGAVREPWKRQHKCALRECENTVEGEQPCCSADHFRQLKASQRAK